MASRSTLKQRRAFAKHLRERMTWMGVSAATLAKQTRIGERSIERYRAGENMPSAATVRILADALDTTIEGLTGAPGDVQDQLDELSRRIGRLERKVR